MKVSPVSADLLIKLTLGAAVIGAAVYAVKRVADALPSPSEVVDSVLDGAGAAANAVSPLNNENVIYRAANAVTGGSAATDAQPLGARIYEWLHPDEKLF
jgi:hypothetical protein